MIGPWPNDLMDRSRPSPQSAGDTRHDIAQRHRCQNGSVLNLSKHYPLIGKQRL